MKVGKVFVSPGSKFLPNVRHGPRVWTWWHRFSIAIVRCTGVQPPSKSWNVWLYTRKGGHCTNVGIDRRKPMRPV